jgi:hypothetical protein
MGFSCVGAREIWCSGARHVARDSGSGVFLDMIDWTLRIWSRESTGIAPVDAPQQLRLAGHGGVLPRLTKANQVMVLFRPSGKMAACILLRRHTTGSDYLWAWFRFQRDTPHGPTCNVLFFWGLSAFVLGHLYLLGLARGCCVCIECVSVI